MKNKKFGFTLIELLVVIVIIGILATISTATFKSYFGKARDAERVSAVQNMVLMIKVDGADDWSHAKFMYDEDATIDVDAYEYAALGDLFTANDFRLPKGTNNICYLIAMRGADNTDVGDNNQFVVMTWGESTSTAAVGDAGVLMDGTGSIVSKLTSLIVDLDAADFACTGDTGLDFTGALAHITTATADIVDDFSPAITLGQERNLYIDKDGIIGAVSP